MITKIGRKNNFYYWGDMKGYHLRMVSQKPYRIEDVVISSQKIARKVINLLLENGWQLDEKRMKTEPVTRPFWGLRIWIGDVEICLRKGEIKKIVREIESYFLFYGGVR